MKKLITLLLVLTGMVCTASAATIYYKKTGNESVPKIHVWGDGVEGTTWGDFAVMTETNLYGVTVYKYDVVFTGDEVPYNFLFAYTTDWKSGDVKTQTGDVCYKWNQTTNAAPTSYDYSVSKVEVKGDLNSWGDGQTMTLDEGVYSATVDLTSSISNQDIKFLITNRAGDTAWYGWSTNTLTKTDTESLLSQGSDDNFTVANGNKTYKTYNVSITLTDPTTWSLTFAGNETRGSQTYNLTVNNEAGWSNVKVYTFSPDLNQSGTWDSTDNMVTSDEGATWTYSKTFYEPYPTKVLFKDVNGNTSNKTDDLYLTNNHTYSNDGTTKYYIIGNIPEFGDFDQTKTIALMTATTDGESHPIHTYSIENLALSSGNVEYKILERKYAEQVASMTYYPMGSNNNKVITVSADGKYNLSIQFNDYWDNKYDGDITSYTITRVTAPVSVGAAGYATYCNANHALDFTDKSIKAYTIACTDGSSLTLKQKNKVAKGEPVLLYSEKASDSKEIPAIADGDASATDDNKLVAGDGSKYTWDVTTKYYILYTGGVNPGFYKANKSTVAVGKAYLDLTDLPATAREFFTLGDDDTTGINAVENGNVEAKATVIYNMNGQRVANPTKGLYIVNGKKVIIK